MDTIVYPHRLSLITEGVCDVCKEQAREVINLNTRNYLGWETCNRENCNQTINNWRKKTSKSRDDLLSEFGESIRIQRRNDTLENDWIISSDCYQEKDKQVWWVTVKCPTRHLSKEVKLSDIILWNK